MPSRSAQELVTLAIADPLLFKGIATDLEHLAPDPSAARSLVSAFRAGQAPAWLTACLLGCIGDEAGYETVRDILSSAHGQMAESYAGPALVKIRGARAFDDLRTLLQNAPNRRSREAAAHGLALLPSRDAATAIFDAALSSLIHRFTAGSLLRDLPTDAQRVLALLCRDEVGALRLGTEIVWIAAGSRRDGWDTAAWLEEARAEILPALCKALACQELSMAPPKRKELMSWTAIAGKNLEMTTKPSSS